MGLFLAAGGVYWYTSGRGFSPPGQVPFVCVSTGKIFTFDREKMPHVFPAANPESGEMTLVPCYVDEEDGKTHVSGRMRGIIIELTKNKLNQHVDPDTLIVTTANDSGGPS